MSMTVEELELLQSVQGTVIALSQEVDHLEDTVAYLVDECKRLKGYCDGLSYRISTVECEV